MAPAIEQRAERKSSRTVTGISVTGVSLAALMAFGTWLVKINNDAQANQQTARQTAVVERYVTEERWRADSTRRDEQFRTLIGELRDSRLETAQRLREICVALRAGCR